MTDWWRSATLLRDLQTRNDILGDALMDIYRMGRDEPMLRAREVAIAALGKASRVGIRKPV